jgi:hypothetical protein
MANGYGGARIGAGRKKKALADRVLEGKEEKVKVIKFKSEINGEDMPPPNKILSENTKGASKNIAKEIYINTWNWLKERKCEHLINPQIIEQYALSVARWRQTENAVHSFGFLAKHPTTQMPIASPFIKISQDFLKQSMNLWLQIYTVVKDNCADYYSGDGSEDPMEILLNSSMPKRGGNA